MQTTFRYLSYAVVLSGIAAIPFLGQKPLHVYDNGHNTVLRQLKAAESLRNSLSRDSRILFLSTTSAAWLDNISGNLRVADIESGEIVQSVQLPFPVTNLEAIDFRNTSSPVLILSKEGDVFRRVNPGSDWSLIYTLQLPSHGRAWIYKEPKTLDSCIVTNSVQCFSANENVPYTLYTSRSSKLFIENFELRFNEPRVGLAVLSNSEVDWGEQLEERSWSWTPTPIQTSDVKGLWVSGHNEDYLYLIGKRGIAKIDWRTPTFHESQVAGVQERFDRVFGSLGSKLYLQSEDNVLEFDGRAERLTVLPLKASQVSVFSAHADANGVSAIFTDQSITSAFASTSFNQAACAVTVTDSRTGKRDDYISISAAGTGSGGIERTVTTDDSELARNCILQIAGTKPYVLETFDWTMSYHLSQFTSGTHIKIKIFPNISYDALLRVLSANSRAGTASSKGPIVVAQGGMKNPQNACQVQTELNTQDPQPRGRQTVVHTTVTDSNPGCAKTLNNVAVLMCHAAGGAVTGGPSLTQFFKVNTTCSIDTPGSEGSN